MFGEMEIEIGNVHEKTSALLVVTPPKTLNNVRGPHVSQLAVAPDDVVEGAGAPHDVVGVAPGNVVVDAPHEIIALVVAPHDIVVLEVAPDDIVVIAPDDVVLVPPDDLVVLAPHDVVGGVAPDDVVGNGVVRPHDVVVPSEQMQLRVTGPHEAIPVDNALA